jgi:cell division protein FtsB
MKKVTRKTRQYITIGVLSVLCLIVGRGVWGMWSTFSRAQTEATIAQKELEKITARSERISTQVAQFEDPKGKEIELRRRFDVGLPGEKLLVVVEEQHPEIVAVEPITWWDRLRASLPTGWR